MKHDCNAADERIRELEAKVKRWEALERQHDLWCAYLPRVREYIIELERLRQFLQTREWEIERYQSALRKGGGRESGSAAANPAARKEARR